MLKIFIKFYESKNKLYIIKYNINIGYIGSKIQYFNKLIHIIKSINTISNISLSNIQIFISIGSTFINSPDLFHILCKSFENHINITLLNLSLNSLADCSIKELKSYILLNKGITKIDLSGNNLTNDSILYLSEYYSSSTYNISILINGNYIEDIGLSYLSKLILYNKIIEVDIRNNKFTNKGFDILKNSFLNNKSILEILKIDCINIDIISDIIVHLKYLQKLYISNNFLFIIQAILNAILLKYKNLLLLLKILRL